MTGKVTISTAVLFALVFCAPTVLGQSQSPALSEPELPATRPAAGASAKSNPAKKPAKAAPDARVPRPLAADGEATNAGKIGDKPAKAAEVDDFEAVSNPSAGAGLLDAKPQSLPPVSEARPQEAGSNRAVNGGAAKAAPKNDGDEFPVYDPAVERVQSTPRGNSNLSGLDSTLPPAREPPGGEAGPVADGPMGDPFLLPAERLTTGPQTVGLRVEVVSPEFANLSLESEFWIKVTNVGPNDASGVTVRYPLPKDVEYVDSEPAAARSDGPLILWQLNTLASRSEKVIKVKIRPLAKGPIDHAVTVTMMAGGRARTMVQQPQLRVDIRADKPKPLKGDKVLFEIDVYNDGDYAARDVVVNALLSGGLKHPAGQELKLALKRELGVGAIAPNQKVSLKLEVETTAMGSQYCDITLSSRDVVEPVQKRLGIDVVAPDLELTISGPSERFPDSRVRYVLTVKNNGTASARNVRVAASIPVEGTPISADPKPAWNREKRRMDWSIGELHPEADQSFAIEVKMGRVGKFTLNAAATYEGLTQSIKETHETDIRGIPRLVLSVTEPRGVLDEGEESVYEIRIRNDGSKEATALLVQGAVTSNLQILGLESADSRGANPPPADGRTAVFPQIDKLPPGAETSMAIRVRALKAGDATCQVTVSYSDYQGTGGPSQTVVTKVTPAHR